MPTNDFIGFASAGSANIMSQADFAAASEQTNGVQPGPASSALANKIWRQGANMAAAIANFIVSQGYNALDNGDIATLTAAVNNAFAAKNALPSNYLTLNWDTVSLVSSSSVFTNLGSVTFTRAGVYFIQFTASYGNNNAGYRRVVVANTSTGANNTRFGHLICAPANGNNTNVILPYLTQQSDGDIIYLNALQTSGSTIDCIGGARVYYLGGV